MPSRAASNRQCRVGRPSIPVPRIVITIALASLVAWSLAGCGGDGSGRLEGADARRTEASSACGPIVREELDPRYLQHILPGAPEPEYTTDPPTSGQHRPAPASDPVVTEPIPRPVQVGELEAGRVLLQYNGLAPAEVEDLAALAGNDVVVAPNPDLPADSAVVATAWLYKRTCASLDPDALEEFAQQRVGHGPDAEAGGHDSPTEPGNRGR